MSMDGLLLPNDNIISGEIKVKPNFKSIVDSFVNRDSNIKDRSTIVNKNIQIPTLNIKSKSFFPFTA